MKRALLIVALAACSDRGVDVTTPPTLPPAVTGDAGARIPDARAPFIGVLVVESVDIAPATGMVFIDAELAPAGTGLREGLAAWVDSI